MAELARRTTICELRRAGSSVSDIIKNTGYAKSTVYRVNSLKAAIRRGFRNLDPEDVKRSCSRFCSKISQIIDANGDHIEWFNSVDNKEQIYTSKNYVSTLFSFQNSEFSKSYVSPNLAARPCIWAWFRFETILMNKKRVDINIEHIPT